MWKYFKTTFFGKLDLCIMVIVITEFKTGLSLIFKYIKNSTIISVKWNSFRVTLWCGLSGSEETLLWRKLFKESIQIKNKTQLVLLYRITFIYSNITVYCPDSILSVFLLILVWPDKNTIRSNTIKEKHSFRVTYI